MTNKKTGIHIYYRYEQVNEKKHNIIDTKHRNEIRRLKKPLLRHPWGSLKIVRMSCFRARLWDVTGRCPLKTLNTFYNKFSSKETDMNGGNHGYKCYGKPFCHVSH